MKPGLYLLRGKVEGSHTSRHPASCGIHSKPGSTCENTWAREEGLCQQPGQRDSPEAVHSQVTSAMSHPTEPTCL